VGIDEKGYHLPHAPYYAYLLHFNVTEVIDTLLMVYGKIALKYTQKMIDALNETY